MTGQGLIPRAIQAGLIVLAAISLFEVVKHHLMPGISLLESHEITIGFTSICASVAAFVVFRKQAAMNEQLAREAKERKEAEEKYRDLFEHANDAILLVDDDLRYIEANRKAEEVLGYSRDELLTMKITDIIPAEQAARSAVEFEKLRTDGSYEHFIGKVRKRDGQMADVEVSSSAIIRDNRVVGSRDILRDITERKKAEAEREKLINELQESLAKVRTLSGMLPICASCKKIRDDRGYWTQIEAYVSTHSAAEFTHSLCPACLDKAMEEVRKLKQPGNRA
jgi:PAS domain S-box-containing protein